MEAPTLISNRLNLMSNKYLEKIAGFGDMVGSVGRIIGNGAKAYGNQVHLALGGGFRDYAHNTLGITNPAKLQNLNGSKEGLTAIKKAIIKDKPSFTEKKEALNNFKNIVEPDLRKKQLDARITAGAITAAGITGIVKGKNSYDSYQQNQQQQQYYN